MPWQPPAHPHTPVSPAHCRHPAPSLERARHPTAPSADAAAMSPARRTSAAPPRSCYAGTAPPSPHRPALREPSPPLENPDDLFSSGRATSAHPALPRSRAPVAMAPRTRDSCRLRRSRVTPRVLPHWPFPRRESAAHSDNAWDRVPLLPIHYPSSATDRAARLPIAHVTTQRQLVSSLRLLRVPRSEPRVPRAESP